MPRIVRTRLKTNRAPLHAVSGAAAAAAFVALARAVSERDIATVDRKVEKKAAVPRRKRSRRVAEKISPVGKWWTYVPFATATALWVLLAQAEDGEVIDNEARLAGAAAIVGTALSAAILNRTFEHLLPQPPAPPGRPRQHPVFPSGHAFGTASVAIAAATVLMRESIASDAVVPLACVVPLISSAARMMEEKHWLSDVVGGYLAAVALSAAPLTAYEMFRRQRES